MMITVMAVRLDFPNYMQFHLFTFVDLESFVMYNLK